MRNENPHKFGYLDGLRGVAALVVVFHHYACGFYPAIKSGSRADLHGRFDLLIYRTPLDLFFAGNLAVCIFFVLSGFVLSYKFLSTGENEAITSGAIRRYFRLMPPVLGSVVAAYLLLRFHLFFNIQASQVTHSLWLNEFWRFPAQLGDALYQGLYGVFLNGQSSYNTNLWTMQAEFFGSYLVFLTLALFGKIRNRHIIYAVLVLIFWKTFYLAFILGVILSDVWTSSNREKLIAFMQKGWYLPAMGLGLLLGSIPDKNSGSNYLDALRPMTLDYGLFFQVAHILGGGLLVLSVLSLPKLQRALSARFAQYLGRVSFSLYAIHLCVIGSLSSYLFLSLPVSMSYSVRVLITVIPSLVVIFVWSSIFTRYLDRPAIKASAAIYKRVFGKGAQAAPAIPKPLPVTRGLPTEHTSPVSVP